MNQEPLSQAQEALARPVGSLKGVGPKTAEMFKRKGLEDILDLIYFIPRAYLDRRRVHKVSETIPGSEVTVLATVRLVFQKRYGGRRVFEVIFADDTASFTARWFQGNHTYPGNILKIGVKAIVSGKIYLNKRLMKEMIHPDFEVLGDDLGDSLHFGRIVPVYSETEGLLQKNIRKILNGVSEEYASQVLSPLPREICRRRDLPEMSEAVREIHFPSDSNDPQLLNQGRSPAHRRLIYDEFFFFQLALAIKRQGLERKPAVVLKAEGGLREAFYRHLPFPLTNAQIRVISEIAGDLRRGRAMNRLLQGDVGSGKTVVAQAAMIMACENDYQAALMAPTEILAEQQYRNIKAWAVQLGIKVVLLTGTTGAAERREILRQIRTGEAQIIIGTQALIEDKIDFSSLALAVIDEQHRFGVRQRSLLRAKGDNPHVLVMTATPIPRTLALTVYGDLDLSVLDEFPPARKQVGTKICSEKDRDKVYDLIRREISRGNQTFIVYPLVEESDRISLKDAGNMASYLQKEVFPEFALGLIHGRLKGREKERIMADFKEKRLDLLVATTVVEVGIDIPEASIMVIEHAERYGLSQLHQLRGRVGRRNTPGHCFLMVGGETTVEAKKRLRIMEKSANGFEIAEEDLEIRGPGEFLGTRQSGLPVFRVGDIIRDKEILLAARNDAFELLAGDPGLCHPGHRLLGETVQLRWGRELNLMERG